MSTIGNTIQATILLDSGSFLTNEEENGMTYSEVGYFTPHLFIYADGEMVGEINPGQMGTGCRKIDVRKYDASGSEIASNIELSQCLLKHLLRLHTVYGHVVHSDRDKYDCLFHFNSGHFCSSKLKTRDFKEVHGKSHSETGRRKSLELIAHDILVHYELEPGETLRLNCDGGKIWSSGDQEKIARRLDIEIMADNSTAEMFYREGLKLMGQNYWLPNQGDPPPSWTHGGPGPSGG